MVNSILLDTLHGKEVSRPPVWFMRQAGRVLPSYNAMREEHSFWNLMRDPELASRVTLLPLSDLNVDAVILFSDILVIPYCLGIGLEFTDNGPKLETKMMQTENPSSLLKPDTHKLDYIYQAIDKIKATAPADVPLIGFAGGPLTVLAYMLEGHGSRSAFNDTAAYIYRNQAETRKIVDLITDVTIEYASSQVRHGIDVFQLFETHYGILPDRLYSTIFMPAVRKIAASIRKTGVPFIYFPKDCGAGLAGITPDICDYVGIDWRTSISDARKIVHPEVGLQGNLDPRLLFADKEAIVKVLQEYVDFGRRENKWIFNLGHGFIPGTPFENAKFVVDWIKTTDWRRI